MASLDFDVRNGRNPISYDRQIDRSHSNMKVLHVLGQIRASGAEVMLLESTPLLLEDGIETHVISTGQDVGDFAKRFEAAGIRVIHVPFSKTFRFLRSFVIALRHERPDIVHIHTERANAAIGVATRLTGSRRIVRTIHNVFFYTGRLRLVRIFERYLLRLLGIQHISIGPSVERNELARLRNPTTRVDNWIGERFRPPHANEKAVARAELEVAPSAFVVSSIGNCSSIKNHEAILRALPRIARKVGRPLTYLHAGSGQHETAERLLAAELGDTVNLRFMGAVDDVRALLWASDVFCMPSLYEGVGNAAIEAIACGVPAVLSDVPGLRDIIAPSAAVKLVVPTYVGVAEGVEDVLSTDPRLLAQAASDAAREIRDKHFLDTQVRKLADVYRNI